jgi:hypothetical protein
LKGKPLLIETEKSVNGDRAGTITVDPLDARNLDTLRRLRAAAGLRIQGGPVSCEA